MTERTLRAMAKELSAEFYEQKRSGKFRSPDALTNARMLKQMPNGTAVEITVQVPFKQAYPNAKLFSKAHWPLFVEPARQCLIAMLGMPDAVVTPERKKQIYDAIIEDRENQLKQDARRSPLTPNGGVLIQAKMEPQHGQ